MDYIKSLQNKARKIRKAIIEAGFQSTSHFGGSLSSADILAYIFSVMKNEDTNNRDRFILSKGHCALSLYATLYEYGFITREELLSFNVNDGAFPTHCVKNLQKGIELSSGSLAMGLSFGIGQAIASSKKHLNNKIYILAGNGESNEGSFWEAVMFAGSKKINNLILVLDDNKMQLDGKSENVLKITHYKEKFESFGWSAVEIDGNNMQEIVDAFEKNKKYPLAIVSNTIKGKGVSFMEDAEKWHHSRLSEDEYHQAIKELEE